MKLSEQTLKIHRVMAKLAQDKAHKAISVPALCMKGLEMIDYQKGDEANEIDAFYIIRFHFHLFRHSAKMHDLHLPSGNFLYSCVMKAHIDAITDANKKAFTQQKLL